MKTCKTCEIQKPLKLFRTTYNKKVGKYYYRSYCNQCLNKKRNENRISKIGYRVWKAEKWRKYYYNLKEKITPK